MHLSRFPFLIPLVLTCVWLVGCGKGPTVPAVDEAPKLDETAPPKAASAVEVDTSLTGQLEVFVPCAFNPPSVTIFKAFSQKYPNVEVVKQVENVEVLAPKIEDGAKPDVFMCVGDIEMDRLEKAGLVQHRKDFCFVGMALVVHETNPKNIQSMADLAKPEVKTVGIGAEGTSPGYYAVELLKEQELWDEIEPKAVRPKFPSQLLKLTGTFQKFDASFAYGACLRAGKGEWKEQDEYQNLTKGLKLVMWLDEGKYCQTIPCPAATITGCENEEAGKALIDFLRTETAQTYLEKSGFTRLDDSKCFK